MPAPDVILNSLATIASEWRWLAAAWHVAILAFVFDALFRRSPRRTAAMLLVLPMISVSALAWWSGNPFNGGAFSVVAVLMADRALRLDSRPVDVSPAPFAAAGWLLLVFGFLYPHFLVDDSWTALVCTSPLGLLPCPTLAAVTGVSLIFGAFGSRRWAVTLTVASLTYGSIGATVLGVWIDTMLIAGALVLSVGGRRSSPLSDTTKLNVMRAGLKQSLSSQA